MYSLSAPAQSPRAADWPAFPVDTWPDTQATLHRWVQIVGKLRLELSPPQNHYWHSTLYVSPHGLTTSPIPYGSNLFQVDFDFQQHHLLIETSWGRSRTVALRPRSVADFYAELMDVLRTLGIQAHIWTTPVEIADTTPFERDTAHASYDPLAAQAFGRALVQADRVFKRFRGAFLGKSSPAHFFWGSFDLAVTRFTGRHAPMWDGPVLNVKPHVMHESYSHELSSAGFWPGDDQASALFYSYAVPQPAGFQDAPVRPAAASYNTQMGEFVLAYERVRTSEDPDADLTGFLETTYAAAADLGGWDRALLEQRPACMCDVRRSPNH